MAVISMCVYQATDRQGTGSGPVAERKRAGKMGVSEASRLRTTLISGMRRAVWALSFREGFAGGSSRHEIFTMALKDQTDKEIARELFADTLC
jgi:hypothetical protein